MGYSIKFIILGIGKTGKKDYELTLRFSEEGEHISYHDNLLDICQEIGSVSQLVSMKFHGLIVASLYGIPSLQLTNYEKNINFLTEIERKDLIASYEKENLVDHLSHEPTSIHTLVSSGLKKKARASLKELEAQLDKTYYDP